MLLLAASLFFVRPAPLDMPRAEATYLVSAGERKTLEDRYRRDDLWLSRALLGRWTDDDGRAFSLFRLDRHPPAVAASECVTRETFETELVRVDRRKDDLRPIVEALSPVEVAERGRPPRQLPHGYRAVDYWQTPTNLSAIVCAFLPEGSDRWFLATWELADGDDFGVQMDAFEKEFLDRLLRTRGLPETIAAAFRPAEGAKGPERRARRRETPSERELMRRDVRHAVALYDKWHFTDAPEFAVIDDLPSRAFVTTLTNDLRVMRARYAAALPTGLDGSNTFCVARIYADREEYLDAVDADMAWTAGVWCTARRELLAHLSPGGADALVKLIRHEAFHQYLSYAAAMIPVSPWLNEGYAQYFEDESSADWGDGIDVSTPERIDALGDLIPALLAMDYGEFYAGEAAERQLRYRLAWSVVRFLEKGADQVRFRPFAELKDRYFRELFRSCDMRKATAAAFREADAIKLFVSEWKKHWKGR